MQYRKFTVIIIFMLFFLKSAAQSDTAYVNRQIDDYIRLLKKGNYDRSYQLITALIAAMEEKNLAPEKRAQVYFYRANSEVNLGKYQKAIESCRKSIALSEKDSDSLVLSKGLNLLGVCYYFLSVYDSTQIYYERSFRLKKQINASPNDLAVSAYNLALAYEDLEETDKALKYYLDAEKYLLKEPEYPNFLADVYVGIAHIYFNKMDIDRAIKYSEKALSEGMKSYGPDHPNITFVYTSYGNILTYKKNYETLIRLMQDNVRIRKKYYGLNHKWTCEAYYKLGKAYALNGENTQAQRNFNRALEIGRNSDPQYYANALVFTAKFYIDQKINLKRARNYLKKALSIRKSIFGNKNESVAMLYYYLAKIARIKGNEPEFFDDIYKLYRSSQYDPDNLYHLISPFPVINALELQGDWYLKKYEKTGSITPLKKAFDLIDRQTELLLFAQKNFSSEISKVYIANDFRESIETSLQVCWKLYEKTQKPVYLKKGFDLSEANRNAVLLSGIKNSQIQKESGIPKDWIDTEKELRKQLSKIRRDLHYERISSKPDTVFINKLLSDRLVLNKKYDSLQNDLAVNHPELYNLQNRNKTESLEVIRQRLHPGEQLITYFLGENALYIFNIAHDQSRFYCEEPINGLQRRIEKLKQQILAQQPVDSISTRLFDLLLRNKFDPQKKELVIVPDQTLNYIPFEVLKDSTGKMLLKRFKISYSGSANLYIEMQKDFFKYDLPEYWVGFTPAYTKNSKLKAATDEGKLISDQLNGVLYAGDEATTTRFLNSSGKFSITHLAMHAEIDAKNPDFNKLLFTDRDLTYSEINVNEIRTNLLVLSACNTGFGKLEKGEGVMSLSRAFHFSGVPAIVMSLWKVPDKETAKIMMFFYKYLQNGLDKREALQKAKIRYIETTDDPALTNSFYWSGFVLTGNPEALLQSKTPLYIYLTIGLLAASVLIFFTRKK